MSLIHVLYDKSLSVGAAMKCEPASKGSFIKSFDHFQTVEPISMCDGKSPSFRKPSATCCCS